MVTVKRKRIQSGLVRHHRKGGPSSFSTKCVMFVIASVLIFNAIYVFTAYEDAGLGDLFKIFSWSKGDNVMINSSGSAGGGSRNGNGVSSSLTTVASRTDNHMHQSVGQGIRGGDQDNNKQQQQQQQVSSDQNRDNDRVRVENHPVVDSPSNEEEEKEQEEEIEQDGSSKDEKDNDQDVTGEEDDSKDDYNDQNVNQDEETTDEKKEETDTTEEEDEEEVEDKAVTEQEDTQKQTEESESKPATEEGTETSDAQTSKVSGEISGGNATSTVTEQKFHRDHYDVCIIGAGLSGAVIAERYASQLGKTSIVLEKRDHIGGNCYDYVDEETGILMNKYGAHLFHTNYERVWEYVQKFSEWTPYEHRVLGKIGDKHVPIPVNIDTVNALYGLQINSTEEMDKWLESEQTKYDHEPVNSEEMALSRVGPRLYKEIFEPYTVKQWAKHPKELGPEVTARIPVRNNHDDRYFGDKYQALPTKGYTAFFEKVLGHELIETHLNVDYFAVRDQLNCGYTYFTGPIDTYFAHLGYEKLEYRSLDFEKQVIRDVGNDKYHLPASVVNYPSAEYNFTRIVEYKHFLNQTSPHTVLFLEHSKDGGDPYYPVPNKRNKDLYEKYREMALKEANVTFVGRLANYKYFNMDQSIMNALELFDLDTNSSNVTTNITSSDVANTTIAEKGEAAKKEDASEAKDAQTQEAKDDAAENKDDKQETAKKEEDSKAKDAQTQEAKDDAAENKDEKEENAKKGDASEAKDAQTQEGKDGAAENKDDKGEAAKNNEGQDDSEAKDDEAKDDDDKEEGNQDTSDAKGTETQETKVDQPGNKDDKEETTKDKDKDASEANETEDDQAENKDNKEQTATE